MHKGQQFAWDSSKAAGNVAKHGVHFEQACEVFFDPLAQMRDASTPGEQRDAIIGVSGNPGNVVRSPSMAAAGCHTDHLSQARDSKRAESL